MGHLLIYSDSFEIVCDSVNRKNELSDFLNALDICKKNKDKTYKEASLDTKAFGFGNFFDDFIYQRWDILKNIAYFDGIDETTHQLFFHSFMENPTGGKSFSDYNEFANAFSGDLYGGIGIKFDNPPMQYVTCVNSWHDWRIKYYAYNNSKISWDVNDHCLPNIKYSNEYLANQYGGVYDTNDQKEIDKLAKDYCDNFSKNGMSRGEQRGVARTVGTEIARRNYYREDAALSRRESILNANDERLIFHSVKNGRMVYISIDFHKCFCYELHDHNGKHLGEYRFDGLPNGPADITGKHNLKALRK